MNMAYAHAGEEHSGPVPEISLLTDWSLDPAFLPVAAVAVLYVLGLRAYRRQGGRRFPRWRPPLFLAGVAVVAVALLSPVDKLAEYSFTWHMLQHQGLIMVGVPLILLGAPFIPVIRGIPRAIRWRWFVPFARNRLVRALFIYGTRPMYALIFLNLIVLFWHFPEFYDIPLENEAVHYVEHFSFVFAAVLFWWNIVTPYPFPSRLDYMMRMALLFLSSIFNTVLGSLITFSDAVLYGYSARTEFWGLTMLSEQQLGGLLMWVGGAMMYLAALTVVFFVYAIQERRKEPARALFIARPETANGQ
jgi:cytochrome c oxidase assembly factor CtaG